MISPLWWLPLIAIGAAIVPFRLVTRRLARELIALRSSAGSLRRVRAVLGQVKEQIIATRRDMEDLARQ